MEPYENTGPPLKQTASRGYVLQPNVNPLIEMMDMREAQRSYEANMNVISTSRQMVAKTLDLLK